MLCIVDDEDSVAVLDPLNVFVVVADVEAVGVPEADGEMLLEIGVE